MIQSEEAPLVIVTEELVDKATEEPVVKGVINSTGEKPGLTKPGIEDLTINSAIEDRIAIGELKNEYSVPVEPRVEEVIEQEEDTVTGYSTLVVRQAKAGS